MGRSGQRSQNGGDGRRRDEALCCSAGDRCRGPEGRVRRRSGSSRGCPEESPFLVRDDTWTGPGEDRVREGGARQVKGPVGRSGKGGPDSCFEAGVPAGPGGPRRSQRPPPIFGDPLQGRGTGRTDLRRPEGLAERGGRTIGSYRPDLLDRGIHRDLAGR